MPKYDTDGPFNDPVVRCCDCQLLILRETIQKTSGCPECGCRRVRNVLNMSPKEGEWLRGKRNPREFVKDILRLRFRKRPRVDPAFMALFEETEVDGQ